VTSLLIILDNWETSMRRLEQKPRQVRQALARCYRYHRTMHDVTGFEQLQVQTDTDTSKHCSFIHSFIKCLSLFTITGSTTTILLLRKLR